MVKYTNHAKVNMMARGAAEEEVVETIRNGSELQARPPALGRSLVFRNGYYLKVGDTHTKRFEPSM